MDTGDLLEDFAEPAWIWSLDGRLLVANSELSLLTGPLNAKLGQHWPDSADTQDIIAQFPNDLQGTQHVMLPIPDRDGSVSERPCTLRLVRRDGQPQALLARCLPAQSEDTADDREAQVAQAWLRQLVDVAPMALYAVDLDTKDGPQFSYFSSKLPVLLGVPAAQLESDFWNSLANLVPEDAARLKDTRLTSVDENAYFTIDTRLNHPEHGEIWLEWTSINVTDADGTLRRYGSVSDITRRVSAEQEVATSAQAIQVALNRLARIANTVPVGLYEISYHPEHGYALEFSSWRFDEMMGLTNVAKDDKIAALHDRFNTEELQKLIEARQRSLNSGKNLSVRLQVARPQENGPRWVNVTMTSQKNPDGTGTFVGAYIDVTNDVEREAELREAHQIAERIRAENEHQALHDALTALPNRRYFDRKIMERLSAIQKGHDDADIILVRIDGDRFKYINDTFGHEAGDAVLARIGTVLEAETRDVDFAARIGGDEFSILIARGCDLKHAEHLVQRVRKQLEDPLFFDGRACTIQASFGIASVSGSDRTLGDLLAFADAALYQAKERGRNRMEVFTPELRRSVLDSRALCSDLQEAMYTDQFVPYFQPQVDFAQSTLYGSEVLLRWEHPERGLLTPDQFLAAAEQLRLLPDLDRIVMAKAHDVLKRLRQKSLAPPRVSFNVSSGRLHDSGVVQAADDLISDGFKVAVEILETTLIEEESDVFSYHLDQLAELGVEIEIDDFGSGHASIISLMAISPHTLKIDRRIVTPVADDPRMRNLVRSIIDIADGLGIQTLAEGIETAEQAQILVDLGCSRQQGFYFARPLSEAAFTAFLLNGEWPSNQRASEKSMAS